MYPHANSSNIEAGYMRFRMIQMDQDTGAEVLYRQLAGERRARLLDW
jgi:hypothetical protein